MKWSVEVVCVRGAREWTSTGRLGEIADTMGMPSHVAHTFLDGDLVIFTGSRTQLNHQIGSPIMVVIHHDEEGTVDHSA